MRPTGSGKSEETPKCQEGTEALQVGSDQALGESLIDKIRRVGQTSDKHRLFGRAVPPDWYLIALAKARVLRIYGLAETPCKIDTGTGELYCFRKGEPRHEDCRQPSCQFGELMRMRLIIRLRAAYARERRKLVGL